MGNEEHQRTVAKHREEFKKSSKLRERERERELKNFQTVKESNFKFKKQIGRTRFAEKHHK